MKRFISFQAGLLFGTVFGAVISAVVCTTAFDALGYEIENLLLIQDCLEERTRQNRTTITPKGS